MRDRVVDVENLSRRFGRTRALNNVSVHMLPGRVYGLVGANGQGKTTLIKHLLGLLRAQSGAVQVFGMDPVRHPVEVLARIGYLSEERELPEWMRIGELLNYTAAFHAGWDDQYARELLDTFRLDPQKRIKDLSKGMRAQAGLIAAVAHRPELLLLDEPSTGLDAVVRRDILNAIVRTVADEERTVLFSSHLLDEVEQMSDFVFMLDAGRVILQGDLDEIKQSYHRWVVSFPDPVDGFPNLEGVVSAQPEGQAWCVISHGTEAQFPQLAQAAGGTLHNDRSPTLQEIFFALVGRDRELLLA